MPVLANLCTKPRRSVMAQSGLILNIKGVGTRDER